MISLSYNLAEITLLYNKFNVYIRASLSHSPFAVLYVPHRTIKFHAQRPITASARLLRQS